MRTTMLILVVLASLGTIAAPVGADIAPVQGETTRESDSAECVVLNPDGSPPVALEPC